MRSMSVVRDGYRTRDFTAGPGNQTVGLTKRWAGWSAKNSKPPRANERLPRAESGGWRRPPGAVGNQLIEIRCARLPLSELKLFAD